MVRATVATSITAATTIIIPSATTQHYEQAHVSDVAVGLGTKCTCACDSAAAPLTRVHIVVHNVRRSNLRSQQQVIFVQGRQNQRDSRRGAIVRPILELRHDGLLRGAPSIDQKSLTRQKLELLLELFAPFLFRSLKRNPTPISCEQRSLQTRPTCPLDHMY
jgi:hypothetical protein